MATQLVDPLNPYSSSSSPLTNPYGLDTAADGEAIAQQGMQSMQAMGQAAMSQIPSGRPAPPKQQGSEILYSPSLKEFYANGLQFAEDDDAKILQAEELLGKPSVGRPKEGDWVTVSPDTLSSITEGIRNPGIMKLFSKNFGIGVDNLQQMAGYGLQLAGAEETGASIVKQQEEDLAKSAPYQRQFTDVESAGDFGEWFVAALGQQGPMLLESVAVALAGFAAGTATAGPLGGALGAIGSTFLKKEVKDQVMSQANKFAADKAKGLAPNIKDDAFKELRKAAGITGAVVATGGSNYALGAADIYGANREQGVTAEDASARISSLVGAFPYAAAETFSDFVIGSRLLKGFTGDVAPKGASTLRRGANLLRRGATGAAVGGAVEGSTEVFQEGIVRGFSGQDLLSDEAIKDYVNSFAAGAAVGGSLGGLSNLRRGKPVGTQGAQTDVETNLLDKSGTATQEQGTLPLTGGMTSIGPTEFAAPEGTVGQGVLDIGVVGQPLAQQEITQRQTLVSPITQAEPEQQQLDMFAPAEQSAPQQLPFQFAPPAPSGIGFTDQQPIPNTLMAQQMQAVISRQQSQQAVQQQAIQQQQEREAQMNLMENQRQLQIAEQDRVAQQRASLPQPPVQRPMVPVRPVSPVQLPLFTPAQAPRPSRGEGLRRGVGTMPMGATTDVPAIDTRKQTQLSLFTKEGKPTVAALKAAGKRGPVSNPVAEKGATQAPATTKVVTPADINAAAKKTAAKTEKNKRGIAKLKKADEDKTKVDTPKDTPAEPSVMEVALYAIDNGISDYQPSDWSMGKTKPENLTVDEFFRDVVSKSQRLASVIVRELRTSERNNILEKLGQPKDTPPADNKPTATGAAKLKATGVKAAPKKGTQVLTRGGVQARAEPVVEQEPVAKDAPVVSGGIASMVGQLTQPATNTKPAKRKRAAAVVTETDKPSIEVISDEIAAAESATNEADFKSSIETIAYHAFVDVDSNNTEANTKARDFITGTTFTDPQRISLNDSLVTDINLKGSIEVREKGPAGAYKPIYKYLTDNALWPRLTATIGNIKIDEAVQLVRDRKISLSNLTADLRKAVVKANPDLVEKEAGSLAVGRSETTAANDATRLSDAIRAVNLNESVLTNSARDTKVADIEAMWDNLPSDLEDFVDQTGTPLSAYFTDGKVNAIRVNRKLRITKQKFTEEQITAYENDENNFEEEVDDISTFDNIWQDDKFDDGRSSRSDGSVIRKPMDVGRIRLSVNKFLSKLARKPKVYVYKDQADMKAKNSRLHQRAADSRTEGDFDSVNAVGFSFGDGNVIIFSSRVATEQQLNFVLAHETLGHFGLRGIISQSKFDSLMETIYDTNPSIRDDVDVAMATEGMGKAEAVEEYLSDFSAQLDTSVVSRIWNAIKGALNKLGVQFGDESVRYFVSQARKYVRDGNTGVPFQTSQVINNLYDIEYGTAPINNGRFARKGNTYNDAIAAALMLDKVGGLPDNFESGWEWLRGKGVDSASSYDKFKSKFLSLSNFRSLDNPGANAMENLIEGARNRSMSLKVEMNEMLRSVLNKAIFNKFAGITEQQLEGLNNMLYEAQRLASSRFVQQSERSRAPLMSFVDGVLVDNIPEIDRLDQEGRITFEQMSKGFSYDEEVIQDDGTFKLQTVNVAGIPNLTKDSIEWTGYNKLRDAMREVEMRLLRAKYMSVLAEQDITLSELGELTADKKLTADDTAMLRKAINTYKKMYSESISLDDRGKPILNEESMNAGNQFLIDFNAAILGKDTDRTDALVAKYFKGKIADDFAAQLNDFKTRLRLPEDNQFIIQNRVKQLVLSDMLNTDADLFTRRSIATGYVPILREGGYQIRVEATDAKTGKPVKLKESSRNQLVYSQFEKESESLEAAKLMNGVFNDGSYELEIYDENDGTFKTRSVNLKVVSEVALDAVAAPPELNLNEFIRGLRQFDLPITPKKMETIVTALTRQNSAARNRLQRAFVKGFRREGITAISRHIESRASTIAKTELSPVLSELLNLGMAKSQKLWNGDPELLERLKTTADAAADPNATRQAKMLAKRNYNRYKYMYQTTNPEGKARRGMQFYNEASRTADFLDGNRNVDESDFGSGQVVSNIRAATSMMQLGASIATGMLNVVGVYTNGMPYLASYNEKNGFGGGFGMGPALAQFHVALKQVGAIGMNPLSETSRAANRAEFYDKVVGSKTLQIQYGLKAHEASFIAQEIRAGVMIPAQSNALVGSARGNATTAFRQKFIDGWMLTFNLTEQASRRSFGLASYRLEHERQKAAGKSDAEAQEEARKFAVKAINLSMGEYSVLNRPAAWRSGLQSFIYMYKVFPTTSIQLFANLSRNGKIGMLAGLFLLSGLTGLPFAEDIEDLVDTIAQKLGFKSGSIRYEIAKFIDNIFPGMSPLVLTGFMNAVTVGNVGSRTSLGNVLPGTGVLLSGADITREMMDIAGPAASAMTGAIKTFSDILKLPFSDQVTALGVVRESPVTIARAFGDAYAYSQTGAIVDKRGYIVSKDMHVGTIASRLMGFYPNAASDQYSMIKIAKRMTDYQRDTSIGFRTAWINAMQAKDTDRARDIESAVDDWNKEARGTALEIRNFRANSMKALREAQRPAGERALKASPKAARDDIERLSNLLSYQ